MKKKTTPKTAMGQKLIESLQDALAFEKGERSLRTAEVRLPAAPPKWTAKKVAQLRHGLHLSQPAFAQCLAVSVATVRAWEQSLKVPSGAASRLLQILDQQPEVISHLPAA